MAGNAPVVSEKREPQYQGAAKYGQKGLIRDLYERICRAPETGEIVAYTFIQPGAQELMRSFGIHTIALPEIQALQCALKGTGQRLIAKAQELGYSDDICGYVHIDVGLMEEGMEHPLGKIPPPDIIVCPTVCNTFIKWSEIWVERFDAPLVLLDNPLRAHKLDAYWGSEDFYNDRRYMMSQIEDFIELLEKLTGRRFDPDALAECEEKWNRVTDLWGEIRALNKRVPAVWDAHTDALYYMGAGIPYRGTDIPITYFEAVKKELQERADLGLCPANPERFRLGLHLSPCWSQLRPFIELFQKKNAVIVWSTYSEFVSNQEHRYDPSRPLESVAESFLWCNLRGNSFRGFDRLPQIEAACREFQLDGMVLHTIKSCRLASTSIADYRNHLQEQGIPSVIIESDLVDNRYFSEAQMRNRVDAFLESLEHKKLTQQSSEVNNS